VHLPDRGRGDGIEVEAAEARFPALAVLAAQNAAHLRGRHGVGGRAQHRQRLGELRGQQVVALEGEQLAELHGRPAHLREPAGELSAAGPREEDARDIRGGGAHQPLAALRQAAERELAGHPSDAGEPFQTSGRHPGPAARLLIAHSLPSAAGRE
jgi:hypothetical protein